jgi:NAD(P)-dependent dehydrogenase (short-subunit alcohol dehydrogenase family)
MNTNQMPQTYAGTQRDVAVIGANGELGRRIARGLLPTHRLTLIVRDSSRIPDDLAHLPHHVVDLREPGRLVAALDEGVPDGGFTGIVNAAGVVAFGAFGAMPPKVTDELVRVNTGAVLEMLDAAARLVGQSGFVVNLTGVAGELTIAGMGAYCASKTGAGAALKVASREFRPRLIRVIDVRLGHCETGLSERSLHGKAPRLPRGVDPDRAAQRIIEAILAGETELPAEAFTTS